jgi:hypothetical protein
VRFPSLPPNPSSRSANVSFRKDTTGRLICVLLLSSLLLRSSCRAYNSTSMSFCSPSSPDSTHPPTSITCLPNHHSPFLSWWPYPASYCLSSNILGYPRTRPVEDQTEGEWKLFKTVGCDVTPEGETLREEMGNEKFLGSMVEKEGEEGGECEGGKVDHPLLFVGRQDRWNPCAYRPLSLFTKPLPP